MLIILCSQNIPINNFGRNHEGYSIWTIVLESSISSSAFATNFQFVSTNPLLSIIGTITFKVPDNYTGGIVDQYYINRHYNGLPVPSDIFVTPIWSSSGLTYEDLAPGGYYVSISAEDIIVGWEETFFWFTDGVLEYWRVNAFSRHGGVLYQRWAKTSTMACGFLLLYLSLQSTPYSGWG